MGEHPEPLEGPEMTQTETRFDLVGIPGLERLRMSVGGKTVGSARLDLRLRPETAIESARSMLVQRHEYAWLRRIAPLGVGRWRQLEDELAASPKTSVPGARWAVTVNRLNPRFGVTLRGPGDLKVRAQVRIRPLSEESMRGHRGNLAQRLAEDVRDRQAAADPAPLLGTHDSSSTLLEVPEGARVKVIEPRFDVNLQVLIRLSADSVEALHLVHPRGTQLQDWVEPIQQIIDHREALAESSGAEPRLTRRQRMVRRIDRLNAGAQ